MKKKVRRTLLVLLVIIAASGIFFNIQTKTNPRVRLLMNTINFTEKTLKNPAYLFYGIDVMELFHKYFNANVSIEGDMSVYEVKNLGFSFGLAVDATRSFEQKKFESIARTKILGIDAGVTNFYVDDEIIYLLIPSMDLSFAFPTGQELFQKMPDLTHDINREWFHDNAKNIFEFTGQIKIEETGDFIRETNGEKSVEYKITIPEGCGAFMWELLGMDMPDYDVVVSMYLNSRNELRRMEIDLSHVMEGAKVVLDGTDVGTLIVYSQLPDGEKSHMVMTRAADKKNTMDFETIYDTNQDVHYTMKGSFSWTKDDSGFDVKMKDMEVLHGGDTLAKVNFNGKVKILKQEPVFYSDSDGKLQLIKRLDWKEIRDDVDGFTKEIMDKLKDVRKNK